MGKIHELFVLALSLVWFAGATPELLVCVLFVNFVHGPLPLWVEDLCIDCSGFLPIVVEGPLHAWRMVA